MADLIDRQSVIDVVHKSIFGFFEICDDNSEEPINEKDELLLEVNKAICNAIKDMPSAQPERKKGKWICQERKRVVNAFDGPMYITEKYWKCSECFNSKGFRLIEPEDNFCSFCGAFMKGEEDG